MAKKKQKEKSSLPIFGNKRGSAGIGGWWISFEEAKAKCCGNEEWWTHKGYQGLEITPQYYAQNPHAQNPPDKPVWDYENGDMYLGEWEFSSALGRYAEQGVGITYNHHSERFRGMVYIGEWEKGHPKGMGKMFWLESSVSWKSNYLWHSPIRQHEGAKSIGRPFSYLGHYDAWGYKSDPNALTTLKDGTERIGPWHKHKPVGNWLKDHRPTAPATTPPRFDSLVPPADVARTSKEDHAQQHSLKCPIAGTLLEAPMRSKLCKHIYSKAVVQHYLKKGPKPCPIVGCRNQHITLQQLEPDIETEILVRRENEHRQRRSIQDAFDMDNDEDDDEEEEFDALLIEDSPEAEEQAPLVLRRRPKTGTTTTHTTRRVCSTNHGNRDPRISTSGPSGSVPLITPTAATDDHHASCSAVARKPLIAQDSESMEVHLPQKSGRSLAFLSTATNGQGYSTSVPRRPCRGRLASNNSDSEEQHNTEEEEPLEGKQQQDRNHQGRRFKRSAPTSPGISVDDGRKRAARPSVVTSIHRNEGLESAATRNRRRLRARNAEIEDNGSRQNIDASGSTQINTSVEDRDEDSSRVLEIAVWLMNDVIGFGYDDTNEAKSYARQIVAFGAHSIQMIVACITPSDVEGFKWMKPLHRRRLSGKLRNH